MTREDTRAQLEATIAQDLKGYADQMIAAPIAPSTPEPAPKCEGTEVTPLLIGTLKSMGYGQSIALVEARDAFGRAKYGQGLMTCDGRDDIEDLEQELGDAMQYAMKARINGRLDRQTYRRLKEHIDALAALIHNPAQW